MLLKSTTDEWKRRFALFPIRINEREDRVWLSWYEVRGPGHRREYRLPDSDESIELSDM